MIYLIPIINTSSFAAGTISFGDLQQLGWLTKQYVPGPYPDYHDIVWTVVGPIAFDDSNGNHWSQGDVITWSK